MAPMKISPPAGRRDGFTLVELLVAAGLSILVMAILATAFQQGMETLSHLKSTVTLSQQLRGVESVIRGDLRAQHLENSSTGAVVRVSDRDEIGQGWRKMGYFRIDLSTLPAVYPGSATSPFVLEGIDSGMASYRATNHELRFTVKVADKSLSNLARANASGLSELLKLSEPGEANGTFAGVWFEVRYFLDQPAGQTTTPSEDGNSPALPLYTLRRRVRVLSPYEPGQAVPIADVANYPELSLYQPTGSPPQEYRVNTPETINQSTTVPSSVPAVSQPGQSPRPANRSDLNLLVDASLSGSDVLLANVVSMQVLPMLDPTPPNQGSTAPVLPSPAYVASPGQPIVPANAAGTFVDDPRFASTSSLNQAAWSFDTFDPPPQVAGATFPALPSPQEVPRVSLKAVQLKLRVYDVRNPGHPASDHRPGSVNPNVPRPRVAPDRRALARHAFATLLHSLGSLTMLRFTPQSPPRRGAILLVVLALLALFAVIGLSFVLYAESEANAARVARGALQSAGDSAPPDATPVAENVVAQILYGDPENDRSDLFGHSLAALKYGGLGGTAPYNGVGTIAGPLAGIPGVANLDRQNVIHWGRFGSGPNNEIVIDPEHVVGGGPFTVRVDSGSYPNNAYYDNGAGQKGNKKPANDPSIANAIYVPKNAPYTYPDRNNALLALVTPPETAANPPVSEQQQIVASSGYRRSLFGSLSSPSIPGAPGVLAVGETTPNNNWISPEGRYMILRPRPADHIYNGTSEFPYPPANADGSITGDVQNYIFQSGQQRNDSFWMYPGLPVTRYKGKNVTALVAPMLLPLDGRVNVNAAGNTLAGGGHGSHSGFGPHEIALWRVLQNATTAQAMSSQIVAQRYNGTVPNPAELPSAQLASSLVTASPPGTRYPAFPTPGSGSPFAVRAFNPAAPVPFTISNPGANSVLQANQIVPPTESQVNFGGAAATYGLPGGNYNPAGMPPVSDPNARYYGSTPDYQNWFSAGKNSAFLPANPSPPGTGAQGDTVGHPLLWNPLRRGAFERGVTPSATGIYPISDMRYTVARYSVSATDIQNQTFLGDPARGFNAMPTPQFSQSGVNSPDDVNRALTTPISNSQQAAMLGANFFGPTERTLQLAAPAAPYTAKRSVSRSHRSPEL